MNADQFSVSPEELIYYLREYWIAEIDRGQSAVLESIIPHLEDEAIRRFSSELAALKHSPPDRRASRADWRSWWLNEAWHNCDRFHPIATAGGHLSPVGQAAVNVLVTASDLREAIESNKAERACALGMLMMSELMMGGYSLDFEKNKAARDSATAEKRKSYELGIGRRAADMDRAKRACIAAAAKMWSADESTRIGAVASSLRKMLTNNLDKLPTLGLADIPGVDTIKGWLRAAAKDGRLSIPADAQRRGRPTNNKK